LFFKIKKGLDIPLKGQPDERIDAANEVSSVAILGTDYVGLKPTMLVREGDIVQEGSPLFEDKKNPGVIITSPAAGTVAQINRGAKRVLVSVVISVDGNASESFATPDADEISHDEVRATLQKSGLWVAFRSRPYGKVPTVDAHAKSIFVNAMDTNPLAVNPSVVINERSTDFAMGVSILSKFDVPVYVCQADDVQLPE